MRTRVRLRDWNEGYAFFIPTTCVSSAIRAHCGHRRIWRRATIWGTQAKNKKKIRIISREYALHSRVGASPTPNNRRADCNDDKMDN